MVGPFQLRSVLEDPFKVVSQRLEGRGNITSHTSGRVSQGDCGSQRAGDTGLEPVPPTPTHLGRVRVGNWLVVQRSQDPQNHLSVGDNAPSGTVTG